MQDEKRRRSRAGSGHTGVFLTIISLISRQHMLSAVRNGSHVSGGKLSEPRQSHRLWTRIKAFIMREHTGVLDRRWISMTNYKRIPERISSQFFFAPDVNDFSVISNEKYELRLSSITQLMNNFCHKIDIIFSITLFLLYVYRGFFYVKIDYIVLLCSSLIQINLIFVCVVTDSIVNDKKITVGYKSGRDML